MNLKAEFEIIRLWDYTGKWADDGFLIGGGQIDDRIVNEFYADLYNFGGS